MSGDIEWVWPAYGFDQWAWSEMNGWVNPEDDPASPTEAVLLDEITRLRAVGDAIADAVSTDDLFSAVAVWEEARRERT